MTTTLLPLGYHTVGSLLAEQATDHPDEPFIIHEGEAGTTTYTYSDVLELARRGAAVLDSVGIGRDDRFGMVIGNRPEFFACWFGAALLGAVMVPMNPQSTVHELTFMLEHSKCSAVVTDADRADDTRAATHAPVVTLGTDFDTRSVTSVAVMPADLDPRAPLAVLYTSGTTSRPKGVVVTHANYLVAGEVIAQQVRMRSDDRWLVVLPMFHANAQYYSTMSALVSGASIALMHRFSASGWGDQARRHGATLGSLFAAPIRMILAQPPERATGSGLLRATYFAQNLTTEQLDDFERRFGCPLVQWYGMTETIAPPVANPLYRRRDNMTIGQPTGMSVRVVDKEGNDLDVGDVGELLVHGVPGVTLMAGYLDDPEATDAAVRDGWLHTGDMVRIERTGSLSFFDREKDMIKRSGENVAAAEVERVVNQHPAVFDSAAVGVPDPIRDEAIKMFVVRHSGLSVTEDDIVEFCRERMVRFKVPSYIEFVDELPRTSVGKVRKHVLRTGKDDQ